MTDPDKPERLTEADASGGEKLGVMRYVLGISLGLVIVAFILIVWRPFG